MMYITVYNLSININYRILAAELNYRFTEKNVNAEKTIIVLFVVTLRCYLINN